LSTLCNNLPPFQPRRIVFSRMARAHFRDQPPPGIGQAI
jgi:hypothetical protein